MTGSSATTGSSVVTGSWAFSAFGASAGVSSRAFSGADPCAGTVGDADAADALSKASATRSAATELSRSVDPVSEAEAEGEAGSRK